MVITRWPAFDQRLVLSKCFESWRWMGRERSVARCQGPSLGSDPLTPQPTLTTPLPPDPWTPTPSSCDLRACHWTSGGPGGNRVWSYSRWGGGGQWWRMERVKKWKLFMWGADVWIALSKRESLCLVLRLIDHLKVACCYPFWSVKCSLHNIFTRGHWCFWPVSHIWVDKCNFA